MLDAIESALLVLLVVLLAFIWLVPIAGKWKVYGKLGMPGWYSIVPVFADYKLCERVHRGDGTRTFLVAYLIVLICSLCPMPLGRTRAIRSGLPSLGSSSGRYSGLVPASLSIWIAMRTMSSRG